MLVPRRAAVALTTLSLVALSCAAAKPKAELEPRYVAVHNTLVAMGLAETGPIQQASLAEGRDATLKLELAAGCTTVLILGSGGVRELHGEVVDAKGETVAKDTNNGSEAVVRACVPSAGPYSLVVKMQRGSGDFLTATWSGGTREVGHDIGVANVVARDQVQPNGTCEAPVSLGAGTVTGNTAHGEAEYQASCANGNSADSKENVYRLDVTSRQRVSIEAEPRGSFDSVLYVRKGDCTDQDAEIACNDDLKQGSQGRNAQHPPSRVDMVLEPGTYFVFVDGYSASEGSYKLTVDMQDVPSLAEVCQRARTLTSVQVSATTAGSFDHGNASCGEDAKGRDMIYKLDVQSKERVRMTEHSDAFVPILHLRSTCTDEHTEVACVDSAVEPNEAAYVGVLDPGAYGVFVDSSDADAEGAFTLDLETSPESGGGTQGDACADAVLLPITNRTVEGDTFAARDDVSGRCTPPGAADVVYRIELPRRLRVTAAFSAQESEHVISLQKSCGDKSTEIACADALDEVLAPGTYFLSVDGKEKTSFGKFKMDWTVRDVGLMEAACRAPGLLAAGQKVAGTTKNASNKFITSCAGPRDQQNSPDAVYKMVIAQRSRVHVAVQADNHDAVLAIRRSCVDPQHGQSPEVACRNRGDDTHHVTIDTWLDPGTYFVVVDGAGQAQSGPFSLSYNVVR